MASLVVLLPITALSIIRQIILPQIDAMALMTLSFWAAFGTIAFTWICKYAEDRRTAKVGKLENKFKKLYRKNESVKILLDKTKNELKEIEESLKIESSDTKKKEKDDELKNRKTYLEKVKNDLEAESADLKTNLKTIRADINNEKLKSQSALIKKANEQLSKYEEKLKNIRKQIKNDLDKNEALKGISESYLADSIRELTNKIKNLKNEKIKELKDALKDLQKKQNEGEIKALKKLENKLNGLLKKQDEEEIKALNELGIDDESDEEPPKSNNQLLIFAALFAIIGGLAITASLEAFIDPDQNANVPYAHNVSGIIDFISSKPVLVLASFFPVAIMFIHCGIIFLSTDAVNVLSKGNRFGVFLSSLLIFFESIVLFYAGTSINNILNFSFWIWVLVIIDIIWVLANFLKNIDVEPQWLNLDLIMLLFMSTILFLFPTIAQVETTVYLFVFLIFISVTVVDYVIGWKTFWGKYDVSDSPL